MTSIVDTSVHHINASLLIDQGNRLNGIGQLVSRE